MHIQLITSKESYVITKVSNIKARYVFLIIPERRIYSQFYTTTKHSLIIIKSWKVKQLIFASGNKDRYEEKYHAHLYSWLILVF